MFRFQTLENLHAREFKLKHFFALQFSGHNMNDVYIPDFSKHKQKLMKSPK